MQGLRFLAGLVVAVVLAGCSIGGVSGSGKVVSEQRQVSGFEEVAMSGIGKLIIEQGDSEGLTITTDDNILPLLTSDVSGGRLTLGTKPGTAIVNVREITYRLRVKSLKALDLSGATEASAASLETDQLNIDVSGAGEVDIDKLTTPQLKIEGSGSSDITITGTAASQDVSLSGAGSYSAADLASKSARLEISGAGGAKVRVSETLDVQISGAGSVQYIGSPRINQEISGAGSVKQISGE